ncbi:hypothetical protein IHQ68_12135 [Chelatococcus sambhunathii]|uniref:Uncharacterized protein n=1 Tax=Chelatococcus sambhunathii TaxID=363953 RepID=A0ABU1DGX5_9HYPH|nr:hypothetical protein [Chelatococcus sambhunathii]MDR4307366.1 hypothetical protein [Chelatococcus sambhunathii]
MCALASPNRDVIAGLDPAIHHFAKKMDARLKSGHDGGAGVIGCAR